MVVLNEDFSDDVMLNFMDPFMGHKNGKIAIDYIEGAMIASWALQACGWWGYPSCGKYSAVPL